MTDSPKMPSTNAVPVEVVEWVKAATGDLGDVAVQVAAFARQAAESLRVDPVQVVIPESW